MEQNNYAPHDPATVKIGGEERARTILPVLNPDGTPMYHRVVIKNYKKKQGKPNSDGSPSFFFSWTFEILDPKLKGEDGQQPVVFGQTNDQARHHYTTKAPLKLLQLIMAAYGGKSPAKGVEFSLEDMKGKTVRVSLENKTSPLDGSVYQTVKEYYPDGTAAVPRVADQPAPADEVPTINIDEEITAADLPF